MAVNNGTTWMHWFKRTKKVLISFLSVCFTVTVVLGNGAYAQSEERDFEAPIIEHEEIVGGVPGDIESFVATVVDNEELKSVRLFYRYAGESEFAVLDMRPVASSAYYSATVDTSDANPDTSSIEYYIRAEDVSGNLVLKGFVFEPLIRSFTMPIAVAPATAELTTSPVSSTTDVTPGKKINWLYVALGVLVVGGIAAGASGGSDDGGGGSTGTGVCEPSCLVNLTIGAP